MTHSAYSAGLASVIHGSSVGADTNQVLRPGDRIRTGQNSKVWVAWSDDSVATFEALTAEYLALERQVMFGHPDDAAYERYGALRDLLFAETIFG